MFLTIKLSIGKKQLEVVQVLFDDKITYDTIDDAKQLLEECLDRHFRKDNRLDGRGRWSARQKRKHI